MKTNQIRLFIITGMTANQISEMIIKSRLSRTEHRVDLKIMVVMKPMSSVSSAVSSSISMHGPLSMLVLAILIPCVAADPSGGDSYDYDYYTDSAPSAPILTHTVEIFTSSRRHSSSKNAFRARLLQPSTGYSDSSWTTWFDLGSNFESASKRKLSVRIVGDYTDDWTQLEVSSKSGGWRYIPQLQLYISLSLCSAVCDSY